MSKLELACPSCGSLIAFFSSISLFAVCSHCRGRVLRKDLDLELLGKVAQLQADGSPLQLGTTGAYKGAAFTIVGRIQLRTEEGFWNEWHLAYDEDRTGWLGEAQGLYAVSFLSAERKGLPPRAGLKVGQELTLAGQTYEVRDLEGAEYVSAEGQLPFSVESGDRTDSADLGAPGGRFATLDYSEDPPLLFTGEYQDFDALKLTGLKEISGW